MHGCAVVEGVAASCSSDRMIVANLIEPIIDGERRDEDEKIRYRSLSSGDGEELIIGENSVTIRKYPSGLILRRVTADFTLLDAFWCEFPNTSADDGLMHGVCMIGHKNLIFAPDTDWLSYTITFPFRVKRVFPSSLGLIFQRATPLPSLIKSTTFPHLFSLSHPYSEMLPIICKNKDSENSSHYIWDSSEVVVLEALNSSQLLLTYSTTARVHSLYCIRKASKAEWKCAASKAESVVSCNTTLTPIGRTSQISTPQMGGSQSRSRFGKNDSFADDIWLTPQTRSVRTRSMTAAAALIQSLPFPTTSPAQRSSANRSITDSPIFRLRGGSVHTTPRFSSFCDDSIISLIETRGSELDLLAPEICIECVWTERRPADPESSCPASNAFITKDFIGQMYACFYVMEQKLLKCIRIKVHDEERVTTSSLTTIPCQGAANIEGRKMMAIIDLDCVVVLYSGITRIGVLYGNYEFITPHIQDGHQQQAKVSSGLKMCTPVTAVRTAFMGHLIMETQNCDLVLCELPLTTLSSFVCECMAQVCSNLPLDKAMKLSTAWCTGNNSRLLAHCSDNPVAIEVAVFVQFVFSQCGITIQDFPVFREVGLLRGRCDEGIREKKKRTANLTRVAAWKRVKERCENRWWTFDNVENIATKCYSVIVNEDSNLYQYALAAFSGLHSAYDLAKLDRRSSSLLFILAFSLHAFAQIFELRSYVEYYRKDFPTLSKKQSFVIIEDGRKSIQALLSSTRFSPERIPSWHENLRRFLDTKSHLTSITSSHFFAPIVITIAVGLKRLESVVDVQKILGKSYEKKLRLNKEEGEQFIDILSENYTAVEKCEKLAQLFKLSKSSLLDLPPAVALILCELLYEGSTKTLRFLTPIAHAKDRSYLPTAEENFMISRLRWKEDLRCINAIQMLDSRRPIFIPSTFENVPETEQRETSEQLLKAVCLRTVTHAFGRSALDFRTFSPPLSRPRTVPQLNLQGRLHPANTQFELPQNDTTKSMIKWGSFYNAVAAGLCLGDAESLHLDCEWLAMSISNLQGAESAGLMYAFGLNGHITNMNLFMIHELLSSGDPLMSISILLGYAVSQRASADVQMYKMMVTHLPFMMGPTLLELHIDKLIQTAALVALGLLFAQSSHLGILGQLINEIGRPASPDQEPSKERYSYCLAAGFAIGLIALGRGEDLMTSVPFMERYPPLASRLVVLMEGGLRSLCVFPTSTSGSGQATGTTASSQPLSNHVRESERVNPHLTASAATVALGLMYLRTENKWAAESLKIPETLSAIEEVRPDQILLRTLCRHLVLWNEIMPTRQWVEDSVPPIVLNYKERLFGERRDDDDDDDDEQALRILRAAVDRETIAQTYLNAMAGACFALAIRFASTWNAEAFKTIMHYAMVIMPGNKTSRKIVELAHAAGDNTCCNVFHTLVNSLGILMAGSGNLEVLRLCRLLRKRVTIRNAYRDHTAHSLFAAVSTTIGMLMLGRGRYALKTDDLSIASLVISFFPVSPHNISDNRIYLQPLRLLWVIAAEERLLSSLDADSDEMVELDVEVTYKASAVTLPDVLKLRTPCIMPELSLLEKIQIGGQEYEKRIFNLRNESDRQQLEEILRGQHGRIVMNYLGRKEQKVAAATIKRLCESEVDPMLRAIPDDDILKAVHPKEMERITNMFRVDCDISSKAATNTAAAKMKPDIAAYDSWIRRFQMDNGSIVAHDYALSFVKDILQRNPLRFADAQYDVLNAFLEQASKQHVMPTELIATLR